jgi:hypothetical protein
LVTKILEIQNNLGIPPTGILDEFTQAAWRNYCLKEGLEYSPLEGENEIEPVQHDTTQGFISTDLQEQPKIKSFPLKRGEFMTTNEKKEWIFLHCTAGWDDPFATVRDWNNDKRGPVGTQFVIGGKHGQTLRDQFDGEIVECMRYQDYGWHLGIGNTRMHRQSIGIELCNLTYLNRVGNDFLMWANRKVNSTEIIDLKQTWRGQRYFQRITNDQLHSLNFLLNKIAKDQNIDITKGLKERLKKMNKFKAFDFDQEIRDGKIKGLFCHTNVSPANRWGGFEKFDAHPQDELIDLINSL